MGISAPLHGCAQSRRLLVRPSVCPSVHLSAAWHTRPAHEPSCKACTRAPRRVSSSRPAEATCRVAHKATPASRGTAARAPSRGLPGLPSEANPGGPRAPSPALPSPAAPPRLLTGKTTSGAAEKNIYCFGWGKGQIFWCLSQTCYIWHSSEGVHFLPGLQTARYIKQQEQGEDKAVLSG